MRYMGGKSKIARPIAEIITHNSAASTCFVSLFCGTCAVEAKVSGFERKILNDKHRYLIAMLRGVQGGYELPEAISKEQYTWLKENKDVDPVLTGFVGFGCSFGGIWFDSYANCSKGRNYCAESKRSLLKDLAQLSDAEFICGDYRKVCIPPAPRFTQTRPIRTPKATTVSCLIQIHSGWPCGCLPKRGTQCLSVSSKPRQIFSVSGSSPLPVP